MAAKRPAKRHTDQPQVVLFNTEDDLNAGERLLRQHNTTSTILRLTPAMKGYAEPANILHVQSLKKWRSLLHSSRESAPSTFLLGTRDEFELQRRALAALDAMRVRLPHVLSSGQDQIFVLDRDQRMVAFFGHWPKEAPWRVEDLLGKHKREILGPEAAAVHEAAARRALDGQDAVYEWSVDTPRPVHLFTAASPLRDEQGAVAGILLVTRDVTSLKLALLESERALAEKTTQLLNVEVGVKQIAASLHHPAGDEANSASTSRIHTHALLSVREREVLVLLRRGMRSRSIGRSLGISVETVRRHVKAMFRKTGVHSQEALVKLFTE